ncbi:MAG: radical SAM protein [Elusimicrobia bacterium]|nr:radical SAM protein [Candidatus Liberimonas magnetica]
MNRLLSYKPVRCILELSYACNLKCKTCNIWEKQKFADKKNCRKKLSLERIKELNKELSQAGIKRVTFLGGEPFLNKDLLDISAHAKSCGLSTAVVTNGALIDTSAIQDIVYEAPLDIIIFSLDGPQAVHDGIRGVQGTYKKLEETVSAIQKLKKKNKKRYPKIYIYATVSGFNYNYLTDIFNFAQKNDVNALKFIAVSKVTAADMEETNKNFKLPAITSHSYAVTGDIALDNKSLAAAQSQLAIISEKAKKIGLKFLVEEYLLNSKGTKACVFAGKDFVISAYGEIYPCPMLPDYLIGNINETSLKDILESHVSQEKFKELNDLSISRRMSVCRSCCVEKLSYDPVNISKE